MLNKVYSLRCKKINLILCVLGLLYFCCLLKFYLIDYFDPDFGLYFFWATCGLPTENNYSSLFILISSFVATIPTAMHIFCLVLLALSLINISFFITKLFKEKNLYYFLCIILLYSCGVFYYVYGKTYYDFPFATFTYSLCLLTLCRFYSKLENNDDPHWSWNFFCLLLGFLLSWKLYNIFSVVGIVLLLFVKKQSYHYLVSILKSALAFFKSICFFFLGYLIGNYNFLFYPVESIKGLAGDTSYYNFIEFLFFKSRIIWDHVNDLPFNTSVMLLPTVLILLFYFPIIEKKFKYFFISIFITFFFYIFITFFSNGLTWHGFPVGLFIVTFVPFLLSELNPANIGKWKNVLLCTAVGMQTFWCVVYYIPLQYKWASLTEQSINVLENKESEIYAIVQDLLKIVQNDSYSIDLALKRYRPVPYTAPTWKLKTYYTPNNFVFLNPLEAVNYTDWNTLKSTTNYSGDVGGSGSKGKARFHIYIVPDAFKQLGDIAVLFPYGDRNPIKTVHKQGYSVYLYSIQ